MVFPLIAGAGILGTIFGVPMGKLLTEIFPGPEATRRFFTETPIISQTLGPFFSLGFGAGETYKQFMGGARVVTGTFRDVGETLTGFRRGAIEGFTFFRDLAEQLAGSLKDFRLFEIPESFKFEIPSFGLPQMPQIPQIPTLGGLQAPQLPQFLPTGGNGTTLVIPSMPQVPGVGKDSTPLLLGLGLVAIAAVILVKK